MIISAVLCVQRRCVRLGEGARYPDIAHHVPHYTEDNTKQKEDESKPLEVGLPRHDSSKI